MSPLRILTYEIRYEHTALILGKCWGIHIIITFASHCALYKATDVCISVEIANQVANVLGLLGIARLLPLTGVTMEVSLVCCTGHPIETH